MTSVGAVNLPWERHLIAWYTGAAAVAVSTCLTAWQIRDHLLNNPSRKCRKYVIRILLMVPLYGFESWLGLRYNLNRYYWETLRDCYEAFVIFSFYMFLIEYLDGEDQIIYKLKYKIMPEPTPKEGYEFYHSARDVNDTEKRLTENAKKDDDVFEPHKHFAPFCCLPQWKNPEVFVYRTKLGTLQYVYIKVIFSLLEFILVATGNYTHGDFSPKSFYLYSVLIENFSQIWAMYNLVLFYLTMKRHLAPIRPVPKFLAIKLVVFFSFWQSVLIAGIQKLGWITATQTYTTEDIASGLQDFLIIWEMLIAAIAHKFVFRTDDFEEDPESPKPQGKLQVARAFASAINVADFLKHKPGPKKYKDTSKVKASEGSEQPSDPPSEFSNSMLPAQDPSAMAMPILNAKKEDDGITDTGESSEQLASGNVKSNEEADMPSTDG
jgi:hypothetical protein